MAVQYSQLANPNISTLKPYQPGKSKESLNREFGIEHIIKLASNENPLGASKKAIAAAKQTLDNIADYPDGSGYLLKTALSKKHQVDTNQITLGNGSDNLLAMICQAFLHPGEKAIIPQYAFATFGIVTLANHGIPQIVPAQHWSADLDSILAAIDDETKLIFLANPNNPTGTWISHEKLQQFLRKLPENVLFVLDEAYNDYIRDPNFPDSQALLEEFPNLIVVRTFSKIYGLASLRVGYAISNPEITDLLNRIRLPFNVSSPALAAAKAALEDQEHIQASFQLNQDGMKFFENELKRLNLEFIPSVANFITFDTQQDAVEVFQQLLKQGIIVRPLVPYKMPTHLRITIGLHEQNIKLIDALSSILK